MGSGKFPLISKKQLASHNTVDSAWVSLYNRKIYDITEFLDEHPGGPEIIMEHAGKDITKILADPDSHVHSESAYEMLDDGMLIGYLATDEEERELLSKHEGMEVTFDALDAERYDRIPAGADGMRTVDLTDFGEIPDDLLHLKTDASADYKKYKFLDLDKPLIRQVLFAHWTKEFYLDQIHRPRHYGKGSAQLFGNFLEPLSLTPWWVIPILWLPPNMYIFYLGYTHLNPFVFFSMWTIGLFAWTLIEYCLHRFLFHLDTYLPSNQLAFTIHFLMHGVHHYLPMDGMRLVMPPALFLLLATPIYKLVFAIFPYYIACAAFAGGHLGYIIYDLTHYAIHHAKLPAIYSNIKTSHLEHHYKNYKLAFGVTSTFWDRVFGTLCKPKDVYQKRA
ncbi:DEKNAAC100535 [Brettanomyces naardenensis]|uniref:Ceramide very long chain fatty acid hydroxylase n=1 Tax=Brettanomyces naardenensis TaxID=13370 RepID=A0A448YER4_BRENA|nr:DEKNAAC100535 [Brettanomyces naardenensis]